MSDADDQMGGTGGPTGPSPDDRKDAKGGKDHDSDADVDEAGKESFPASDPPANY